MKDKNEKKKKQERTMINNQDKWDEVMRLAQENGFIAMAYGGVAILICHEEQKKQNIFEQIQVMNNLETK